MTDRSNYRNYNSTNFGQNKFPSLNLNQQQQQQQQQQFQQQQQDKLESDKAFLERTNVNSILSKLIESLNNNEPEDPIGYICNYFEGLNQNEDQTNSLIDRLQTLSFSSPLIDDLVLEMYTSIAKIKSPTHTNNNKKQIKIQITEQFNSIIDTLTDDLFIDIRDSLRETLKKRENDYISFDIFKATLKIIALLKEFIYQSKTLFNELEIYSSNGKVSKQLCDLLIEQLRQSLSKLNNESNQAKIESLYLISPSALKTLLNEKFTRVIQKASTYLELNDFILMVAKLFFEMIVI